MSINDLRSKFNFSQIYLLWHTELVWFELWFRVFHWFLLNLFQHLFSSFWKIRLYFLLYVTSCRPERLSLPYFICIAYYTINIWHMHLCTVLSIRFCFIRVPLSSSKSNSMMVIHFFAGWCTIRVLNRCITQMQASLVERLICSCPDWLWRKREMWRARDGCLSRSSKGGLHQVCKGKVHWTIRRCKDCLWGSPGKYRLWCLGRCRWQKFLNVRVCSEQSAVV